MIRAGCQDDLFIPRKGTGSHSRVRASQVTNVYTLFGATKRDSSSRQARGHMDSDATARVGQAMVCVSSGSAAGLSTFGPKASGQTEYPGNQAP